MGFFQARLLGNEPFGLGMLSVKSFWAFMDNVRAGGTACDTGPVASLVFSL